VIKARELAAPDEDHRPVGAIVLECTNLPPYAAAVQEAVRLPVYDVTTMIEHLHSALVRRRFTGQGQLIA
jgi:Asp/Glu/hydantoin racemase